MEQQPRQQPKYLKKIDTDTSKEIIRIFTELEKPKFLGKKQLTTCLIAVIKHQRSNGITKKTVPRLLYKLLKKLIIITIP